MNTKYDLAADALEAIRDGLRAEPLRLPAWLLYDDVGSALFEAITHLEEYGVTRADHRLIDAHAADGAALVGVRRVVELGPGGGAKALAFLARYAAGTPVEFDAVDVSAQALRACERTLADLPHVRVRTHEADYVDGLRAAIGRSESSALVLFLGSNVSNFDPPHARELIESFAGALRPADALLLAFDLVKDRDQLVRAYDDEAGVTAAFNRNLIVRLNQLTGAAIDPRAFRHEARWNADARRIEMHLVARDSIRAELPAVGETLELEAGQSIWTEASYRYSVDEVASWARAAGFRQVAAWTDTEWPFAHLLLERDDRMAAPK